MSSSRLIILKRLKFRWSIILRVLEKDISILARIQSRIPIRLKHLFRYLFNNSKVFTLKLISSVLISITIPDVICNILVFKKFKSVTHFLKRRLLSFNSKTLIELKTRISRLINWNSLFFCILILIFLRKHKNSNDKKRNFILSILLDKNRSIINRIPIMFIIFNTYSIYKGIKSIFLKKYEKNNGSPKRKRKLYYGNKTAMEMILDSQFFSNIKPSINWSLWLKFIINNYNNDDFIMGNNKMQGQGNFDNSAESESRNKNKNTFFHDRFLLHVEKLIIMYFSLTFLQNHQLLHSKINLNLIRILITQLVTDNLTQKNLNKLIGSIFLMSNML
ncbi:hypothetical protein TBLA_0B06560 [Henningerozyma blattae CBS 6284]|uniref:Uncharacterized protein n=1 Tax=Henningerozyma blattae (strain ATCC 34711 / CBS 6284 / DSM 70876 / NBRC 10599 / NRRL Y-10934 / UCD 77-7) TaxID=1071380 RepID=I2GZC7_HENB6|nr:hypothetical protein TBLA_0B06560 [Tetrapisispora blattae CBS 6284]CCH59479.1 hypothetical protein TBLA_0B06560 [Tetrapisispora blattae CBS 6284]